MKDQEVDHAVIQNIKKMIIITIIHKVKVNRILEGIHMIIHIVNQGENTVV